MSRVAWGAMATAGFLLAIGSPRLAREVLRRQRWPAACAATLRSPQGGFFWHGVAAVLAGLLGLLGHEVAAFAAVLVLLLAAARLLRRLPPRRQARPPRPRSTERARPRRRRVTGRESDPG